MSKKRSSNHHGKIQGKTKRGTNRSIFYKGIIGLKGRLTQRNAGGLLAAWKRNTTSIYYKNRGQNEPNILKVDKLLSKYDRETDQDKKMTILIELSWVLSNWLSEYNGPRTGAIKQLRKLTREIAIEKLFGEVGSRSFLPVKDTLTKEETDSLQTYVKIANEGSDVLQGTENFMEALKHLSVISNEGTLFERVMEDLQKYKNRERNDFDGLKTFIEYQVFRKGEHLQTKDEEGWINKIIDEILPSKLSHEDLQIVKKPENRKKVEAELVKNYMCKCRYSKPSVTLMHRGNSGFINDRLRVKERKQAYHIFETKNGYSVAYDPMRLGIDFLEKLNTKKLLALQNGSKELKNLQREIEELNRKEYRAKEVVKEFVPFNSDSFMLADIQVPVMDSGVEISIKDENNNDITFTIGEKPEDVGIEMTDEPAGVYKRSLNSQRVIEFADWDNNGKKTVLQFKGAGVPAYGFSKDSNFSGGEYLALTIEKNAMLFKAFVEDVFQAENVVPDMVGVSMVSAPEHTSAEDTEGRNGAVSVRRDDAMGVRLSNVLYENVKTEMRDKLDVDVNPEWRNQMTSKLAQNMAYANLFGLQYNDSGVQKLVDIGVNGEFSDSGGLWNVGEGSNGGVDLVSMALKTGSLLHLKPDKVFFDEEYVKAMITNLKTIRDKANALEKGKLEKIIADLEQLKGSELEEVLKNFAIAMGGDDDGPTKGQLAYEYGGVKEFAKVVVDALGAVV